MIGYRFMYMHMGGNRDGTDSRSVSRVLQDFPVSPTSMSMQMHMAELMYAPTNDFTLMAMFPYRQLSMEHVTRMGTRFTTDSAGPGDLTVKALYSLYGDVMRDQHRVLLNTGVSFPTGSIDEKDGTPAGPNQKLPYPMQLGSGTFDLYPGLTYLGEADTWAWGAEMTSTLRLGKNSNRYTLGNQYRLSVWGAHQWTDWLASSIRLDGHLWDDIDGADPDLNPAIVPTADPNRRSGKRLDLLLGGNLYIPRGLFKGVRVAFEYGFPVYQYLDGPQLEMDWRLTAGLSVTWTF